MSQRDAKLKTLLVNNQRYIYVQKQLLGLKGVIYGLANSYLLKYKDSASKAVIE